MKLLNLCIGAWVDVLLCIYVHWPPRTGGLAL